ncbi:MAG: hypothetical protein ACJA06_002315 [Halocynthiibacter sp.]|jgi:hypothetical protein
MSYYRFRLFHGPRKAEFFLRFMLILAPKKFELRWVQEGNTLMFGGGTVLVKGDDHLLTMGPGKTAAAATLVMPKDKGISNLDIGQTGKTKGTTQISGSHKLPSGGWEWEYLGEFTD